MPDEFEDRLRSALRRETSRLPFLIETDAVEARLRQPDRRFPRWLTLAAVPVATAVVIGVLLAMPRPVLLTGLAPLGTCEESPVIDRGSYSEVGGPRAFFRAGDYDADADWMIFVRLDPTPAPDARLRVWATHPATPAEIEAIQVDEPTAPVPEAPALPGVTSLAVQPLPWAGCWTLHAAVDGREVGTATIGVAPEPISACDQIPNTLVPPTKTHEQGGPRAFFLSDDQVAAMTVKLWVRVEPMLDQPSLQLRLTRGGAESRESLDRIDGSELAPAPELPGTQFFGAVDLSQPGCWQIEAVVGEEVIGSAIIRSVGPTATPTTPAATPQVADAPGARSAAAWTVSDGRLYLFGGLGPNDRSLGSAYVFDPTSAQWQELPPMPSPRIGAAAVAVPDGRIFVFGGRNADEEMLDSALVYDPTSRTWSEGPPMPGPQALMAATFADASVYLFGGTRGHEQDVFAFDPATSEWSARKPIPSGLSATAITTIGDDVYLFGGRNPEGVRTNLVYRYDPAEDSWERMSDAPYAGSSMTATLVDDRVWLIGGDTFEVSRFGAAQVYDLAADAWTIHPFDRPTAGTGRAAITLTGGRIMLVGGCCDEDGPLAGAEIINTRSE